MAILIGRRRIPVLHGKHLVTSPDFDVSSIFKFDDAVQLSKSGQKYFQVETAGCRHPARRIPCNQLPKQAIPFAGERKADVVIQSSYQLGYQPSQ